jgi:hypothetical protein
MMAGSVMQLGTLVQPRGQAEACVLKQEATPPQTLVGPQPSAPPRSITSPSPAVSRPARTSMQPRLARIASREKLVDVTP